MDRTKKETKSKTEKKYLLNSFLVSALMIILTSTILFLSLVPFLKNIYKQNLKSNADMILTSINENITPSVITDDQSFVIEYCSKIVAENNDVHYIILTSTKNHSLIHKKDLNAAEVDWQTSENPKFTPSEAAISRGSIVASDIVNTEVFHYAQSVSYSKIDWGWLQIGMSLDNYNQVLYATIKRIISLAFLNIVIGIIFAFYYSKRNC